MAPLIYAHRGASGLFPENTMESFYAAVRRRANGIELDVQLTRDDKLVVIHDHTLDRTTTGSGLVRRHTMQELKQLRADRGSRFSKARIPTLREVFQAFSDTPLRFIIELKNFLSDQPDLEERVIELIRRYHLTERTIISSFNFDSLLHIKKLDPSQTTGLLYVGPMPRPWEVALRYQADQLHVPVDQLTADVIDASHRHDLTVLGWTVNSTQEIEAALDNGVDGLITNYPGRARKILRARS
ncbi:glycerophosphodiester phosphodiesterase [Brevibacillus choshinensis]|uniref:Glycerophosphodiester phosphodiesterase n=1 Tax=Brevibacillus choshinensis TaxID=54911 RepID=A0ABX7FU39_BRECH|nr:glycerophosphodiester phosphodiesterase family protein [Brevibacillus choshinensis]QRG69596.1 glycerophosphodiester phosphodiesterase [Brevibacillus choshinensis]